MAWIEVHQSLVDHRKVVNASAALGRGTSPVLLVGHLVTLWSWALDNAEDGGPLTASEVAHGARWTRDAQAFTDALVSARLLDHIDGAYWLHDWADYAGRLVGKRRANRERMRSARATNVPRTDDARAEHVQGLPYRTQPTAPTQPTEPNQPSPASVLVEVPLRVEFWNRGCKLRGLLSLSAADEAVIDSWIESGVTLDDWQAVDAEVSGWDPPADRPWAAFKSAMGNLVSRGTRPTPLHQPRGLKPLSYATVEEAMNA